MLIHVSSSLPIQFVMLRRRLQRKPRRSCIISILQKTLSRLPACLIRPILYHQIGIKWWQINNFRCTSSIRMPHESRLAAWPSSCSAAGTRTCIVRPHRGYKRIRVRRICDTEPAARGKRHRRKCRRKFCGRIRCEAPSSTTRSSGGSSGSNGFNLGDCLLALCPWQSTALSKRRGTRPRTRHSPRVGHCVEPL